MATNRFYLKTKFAAGSQERQTLKRSCDAIAWQWDIYLVPQNVFLVLKTDSISLLRFSFSND